MIRTFLSTAAVALAPAVALSAAHATDHHKQADYSQEKDIVDTASAAGEFKTLLAAVDATGLVQGLKSEGPFTVFAPTDEAFEALPDGTVDDLLQPENREQLAAILTYHVLPGMYYSDAIAGKSASVATFNGAEVDVDGTDGVTVDGVPVVKADIEASNGVIHVIDEVLMP